MSSLGYLFRRVISAPKSIVQTRRAIKHFEKHYNVKAKDLDPKQVHRDLVRSVSEAASQKGWSLAHRAGRKVQNESDMQRNYFLIKQTFLRYPLVKDAKVASIGCGLGTQELFLARDNPRVKVVRAIDPTPEHIIDAEMQKKRREFSMVGDKVVFSKGGFKEPMLPKGAFDCVMSIDALHWAEDRYLALKNLKDLINPTSKNKLLLLTYREKIGDTRMEATRKEFAESNFSANQVKTDLEQLGFVIDPPKKLGKITMIVAHLK